MNLFNIALSILLIFLSLSSSFVFADTEPHYLLMYGDVDKSSDDLLTEADNIFIVRAIRTFGTREHASEGYTEHGFNHYSENKLDKSMQRFNQAWLLNRDNQFVYLGFGLLLIKQNKLCEATEQFSIAREKGLDEGGFLADYAHTLTKCALLKNKDEQNNLFSYSNKLYEEAIKTHHNNVRAYAYHSWAKSYFLQNDYSNSLIMLNESIANGGKPDEQLAKLIKEKQNQ